MFTGVTVQEPANCGVATAIATNPANHESRLHDRYRRRQSVRPDIRSEGFFTINFTGETCPIETAIIPRETVFVKAQNATGTQAVEQKVNSSATINTEAGGSLYLGKEAASLTGEAAFELTSGARFGTH